MVLCAIFAALAYAVMFVFRFNVQFLTFDLKDAVITVAGLLLGPVAALVISLLVAVLEFITVSDTGLYGFVMNFASSAVFSVTAAVVYTYRKRLSGAIVGLAGAAVSMTAVMMLLNLLVTPLYMGVSTEDVAAMIPMLLLPFNLAKALTNAALVIILYKSVSRALRATKLLPGSGAESPSASRPWVSAAVVLGGALLLVAVILFFRFVLHGEFELF